MTKVKSITNVDIHNDDEAPVEDLIACSEDKLHWINLTDLADEKYPEWQDDQLQKVIQTIANSLV